MSATTASFVRRTLGRAAVMLGATNVACQTSPMPDDVASEDAPSVETSDAAMRCDASFVASFRGSVIDDRGAPIARARPQLCARLEDDRLVCLDPPFTDALGAFVIEVPSEVRCMRTAVVRVLVTGGPYATTYCPVAVDRAVGGVLALEEPLELFEVVRHALPPYGDPSTAREVSLGDALVVQLRPESIGDDGDYARLGAVRIGPSRSCVPAAQRLDGLLAAGPEAAVDAPFRILASGLPSGARVTLHVIGGLDTRLADGSIVEEGALAAFGEGLVGVDGTITPEPTVLLPQLGWLGWSITP